MTRTANRKPTIAVAIILTLILAVSLVLLVKPVFAAFATTSSDFAVNVSADDAADSGNVGAAVADVTITFAASDITSAGQNIILTISGSDYGWVAAGTADTHP